MDEHLLAGADVDDGLVGGDDAQCPDSNGARRPTARVIGPSASVRVALRGRGRQGDDSDRRSSTDT